MAITFTNVFNPLEGLVKLRLDTFLDEGYSTASKSYLVMYNPSSYSFEYKNKFDVVETNGNQALQKFKGTESDQLTIELLFDATGASVNEPLKASSEGAATAVTDLTEEVRSAGDTADAIGSFIDELNAIHGDEHKPRYVQVIWGKALFKGILDTAKVDHVLFKATGEPIRSKVQCTFKTHQSLEEQAQQNKKNSPDLTRFKQVKAEDRLSLIAFDTYKDPALYLELARVNRLNNFRSLALGTRLRLPPIEK